MVGISPNAADQRIGYEQLKEFLDGLYQSGFRLSVTQYISANRLLLGLLTDERIQSDPRSFRTYLAPVICSSPSEQREFYRLFDEWLAQIQPSAVIDAGDVDSTLSSSSISPITIPVNRKHNLVYYLLALALLAAASLIYSRYREPKSSGTVVSATSQSPQQGQSTPSPKPDPSVQLIADNGKVEGQKVSPTPTPDSLTVPSITFITYDPSVAATETSAANQSSSADNYLRYFVPGLIAVTAFPFFIYLLWRIWLIIRRRQLERWRTREQPELFSLAVKGGKQHLFRSSAFRTFAQELRRHRRLKSDRLDAPASVDATASSGGLFTPIFEAQQLTPEYLILIDAHGFQDQQAQLDEEIIKRLQKEGVFVDHYYFNSDPRVCQTPHPLFDYRTLEQLATRHPDHRLVVFSDGSGLIDPMSGRPHTWVEQFSHWPLRALITAEPAWGYREWALEQTGLTVLPAAEAGLVELGRLTRDAGGPRRTPGMQDEIVDYYPVRLLEDPKLWTGHKSPPAEEIEELGFELRYYLGNDGYYLLCACAVYPALIWDLTLYFSSQLIDSEKLESTVQALVRLPWLRTGVMPDWLRTHLISSLSSSREAHVRKLLQSLLMTYIESPKEGFDLDIAREPAQVEESGWRKPLENILRKLNHWKLGRFLLDAIRTAPEDSPLRDYVFLNFMSRSKLAVLLPGPLRRFIYSQGQPILGLRPLRALVLPLAFAIVGGMSIIGVAAGGATDPEPPRQFTDLPRRPVVLSSRDVLDPYKIRSVSGLPSETPDIKGRSYTEGVTAVDAAIKASLGSDARVVVSEATLIDELECLRDLQIRKCLDLVFRVVTPAPDKGFEILDDATGREPDTVVTRPNYTLRINNLGPNSRRMSIIVRYQEAQLQGVNLSIPGGGSTTVPIRLNDGLNAVYVSDGTIVWQKQIEFVDPFRTGTIRLNFTDAMDGRPVSGEFIIEPAAEIVSNQKTTVELRALPGRFKITGSAKDYESDEATVTVAGGLVVTVDFKLEPVTKLLPEVTPEVTPPPPPSPTPTPLPMIVGINLTFDILENNKDDGSAIVAKLILDRKEIRNDTFGQGEDWKSRTQRTHELKNFQPLRLSDCERIRLELSKTRSEPGSDTWEMEVTVTMTLSDKRTPTWKTKPLRLLDGPMNVAFTCPAISPAAGVP